ncbi:MAG: hypothetical protein H6739_40660 [Alphaproteobacteria bacterium]|nr:hypothetical protein [Alphaproteobacteria bacterium]
MRPRHAPVIFLVLAIAWTWPAAIAWDGWLVGRHFDLPGTAWFLSAGPRMGLDLHDPLTGWPEGITYYRPDSYVLLVASWLLQGLPAHVSHGLLQVLGVTASAWAAEAFARAAGARMPWSLLAGLAFGFSGLAANALLEGHVYHVMDPWMPLFGWAWLRATGPGGRPHHGALAALFFALTTMTTAYLGLAAAVIAVGFAFGGLAELRLRFPFAAALTAAAGVGVFGAWYLHQFSAAGAVEGLPGYDAASRELFLMGNSTDLVGLLTPTPAVDRFFHAAAPTFSATALCLAGVAPLVLSAETRWKTLLGTGLAALVLSMGPWLHLGETWIPLPMVAISDLPAADLLRHPRRLGWAWVLCGGVVAALVATRLAEHRGRAAWPLLACALIDAFVVVGLPLRQGARPAQVPSAYLAGEGAVFDLFPTQPGLTYELNGWLQGLACWYQTGHGRPIVDDCVVTRAAENPRVGLSQTVLAGLLEGETGAVLSAMRGRRVSAIALHGDLFHPSDRARLIQALSRIDPDPVSSADGGEALRIYRVR